MALPADSEFGYMDTYPGQLFIKVNYVYRSRAEIVVFAVSCFY